MKWIKGRIIGCQSTNHTTCNEHTTELWQCPECNRRFCDKEGADLTSDAGKFTARGNPYNSLCDDCREKENNVSTKDLE